MTTTPEPGYEGLRHLEALEDAANEAEHAALTALAGAISCFMEDAICDLREIARDDARFHYGGSGDTSATLEGDEVERAMLDWLTRRLAR